MQFSELQTELQARLSVASSNTFWTSAMIKVWLNEANKWACNYKKWPFTEKAVYTSSKANAFYYDYPLEFKSDSISRLEIEKSDGKMKEYKKVRYQDFMKYIRDNPDGEDLIFSDFRRQYFINPVVEVNGREICLWGQEKPTELVNDVDLTPFAEGEEAGEEAIIKRALGIALQKGKKYQEASIQRDEAKLILEEIWTRIQEEQVQYQSKDRPFFDVPQLF